jgi:hypothetical protein
MGAFSDFWEAVWREPTKLPVFERFLPSNTPEQAAIRAIKADEHYIALNLRSLYIPFARTGLTRFFGAAFCYARFPALGGGDAEYQVFRVPVELQNLDKKHVDRLLQLNSRLVGPLPYRGGDFEFQLALFTIATADMLAPFLDLLQSVSQSIPSAFASTASTALGTVRKGMDAFKQSAGPNSLQVGVHQTKYVPETGVYLLASTDGRRPSGPCKLEPDGRVIEPNGNDLKAPYIVFEITATERKDDWFSIPELSSAYAQLRNALKVGKPKPVQEALVVLQRAVLLSNDLVPADAERIVALVKDRVDGLQQAGLTSAADAPQEVEELQTLKVYD